MASPSSGSPSLARLERQPVALSSDTVVFSHTKVPSRQSNVVAGSASPAAACRGATPTRDDTALHPPSAKKFRVEAPRGDGLRQLMVRVVKHGDRLGFGVRHDRYKRLQVSTLQGCGPQLRVGDTLLSVNGVDLTGATGRAFVRDRKDRERRAGNDCRRNVHCRRSVSSRGSSSYRSHDGADAGEPVGRCVGYCSAGFSRGGVATEWCQCSRTGGC
jgi:hypothetical protein